MKLFPPGYQFLDSNGAPVNSGTVSFYANGTTDVQAIYTNAALTSAATNPAPLNSAGRFNQGDLYGEGTYTVVLKTSASTQLWSRDDFNAEEISQGADIASATSLLVNIPGTFHDVTGTTQITSFETVRVGSLKILQFDGALTLTHHATDLILPGAVNKTTVAGDIGVFYEYATGDWRCVSYSGASAALGQIQFPTTQNASSNANTLDDYEENTWTPVLTFATPGNLSVTYTSQVGTYTKIGRVVFYQFEIITSGFTHTTASGNMQVTGLPFTSASTSGTEHAAPLEWSGITKTNYTAVVAYVGTNVSLVGFLASGSGVGQATVAVADVPSGGSVILRASGSYDV